MTEFAEGSGIRIVKNVSCFLVLAFCTLTVSISAQDEPNHTLTNCVIVLEVYALDRNAARDVLESTRGDKARYQRVRDLQQNGKARLEILSAVTTNERADDGRTWFLFVRALLSEP